MLLIGVGAVYPAAATTGRQRVMNAVDFGSLILRCAIWAWLGFDLNRVVPLAVPETMFVHIINSC